MQQPLLGESDTIHKKETLRGRVSRCKIVRLIILGPSYSHEWQMAAETTLLPNEKIVVRLVVSQLNNCGYSVGRHSINARMTGLTDDQIGEIKAADIKFDHKLSALALVTKNLAENRGQLRRIPTRNFYAVGFTRKSLDEVLKIIVEETISHYQYYDS